MRAKDKYKRQDLDEDFSLIG